MSGQPGTALVTGAAGFVGSHLTEALLDRGVAVRGVDVLNEHNGRERKEANWVRLSARDGFEPVVADLRDVDLAPLVADVPRVFHLAALPGVRTSWGDAFREYSSTNIDATARLLEACRVSGVKRFVYASSSSVYGEAERFPVSETDPTRPISPYGVSKLAGEHLVRLYGRAFGLFTVSLRFFTVYGPGQRPDMAFHRFIRGVLTGEECRIFGDGTQTRDYTYVADAVQSCLGAAEGGEPGAVYNVGGGSRVNLRRVIEIIEAEAGRAGTWAFVEAEKGDPKHTAADTSRARAEIGYNPTVTLEEGLRQQVAWMTDQLAEKDFVTETAGRADVEPAVSLVIPLYNEAESLEPLHRRIVEVFGEARDAVEIIFVDDGSSDGSLAVLERLAEGDDRVRVLSFRRNYGKSAALSEGFARVHAPLVATMDADLQDDPGEVPGMIALLESEPCDLVSGWKKDRHDPASKRWPSKLFNLVVARVSGVRIHDMNCGLKVYRREVVDEIPVYGEFHRFLPMLAAWRGFEVREKVVRHEPRRFGTSKFGASRFVNGFLDLLSVTFLTAGQKSPLHLFGRVAMALLAVGMVINLWMFGIWIVDGALRSRPLLILGMVLCILGIQFISIGLLGEMLAFYHRRRDHGIKREIR